MDVGLGGIITKHLFETPLSLFHFYRQFFHVKLNFDLFIKKLDTLSKKEHSKIIKIAKFGSEKL